MNELKRWRERLIKLPESTLLDLFRNYLGDVRTPFNKQDLLQRLENFLAGDSLRQRLVAALSLQDRQSLSAIHLAVGATEEMLFRLIGGGRSYIEFHLHILNLEDRLLVYRENQQAGLNLNPLMVDLLIPLLSESLVVPSDNISAETATDPPWCDDRFLMSLFAFIGENPDVLTTQGVLKKRFYEDFSRRFASLAIGVPDFGGDTTEAPLRQTVLLVIAGLRRLGLLVPNDAGLELAYERWLELADLYPAQRQLLVWAACMFPQVADSSESGGESNNPAFFSQARISGFARSLVSWVNRINPGRQYSLAAIGLLWDIHAGKPLPAESLQTLLRHMALLGLLTPTPGNEWRINPHLPKLAEDRVPLGSHPPITLTPSFELTLTADLEMTEMLLLASFCQLESHGQVPRFVINRKSCQSGFARGIGSAELIDLLSRKTGHELPQNIRFSLEDWYKDFTSVRIFDGVTIACEGQRRTQIEHLPEFKAWIIASLAPGIMVLDRHAAADWLPILEGAGIPIANAAQLLAGGGPTEYQRSIFLPPLLSLDLEGLEFSHVEHRESDAEPNLALNSGISAQAVREELFECLKGLAVPDDLREELAKRIRTGLILLPTQLLAGSIRVERSEARGLDYTAKIRLIEQAIKSRRDFLEITQHNENQKSYSLLVWPHKIRQVGHELLLSAQTVPEGKELSLVVGKIILVRRVRVSIFG